MKTRTDEPISVRDRDAVRERRPLLIAHRGGVVAPGAPENTRLAMELAALYGYDMVELDVWEAKDGEPILFHDWNLRRSCGVDALPGSLTSEELSRITHVGSAQHIPSLVEALALCRRLGLGIMFDVKHTRERPTSDAFLGRIGALVHEHGLAAACVTISSDPLARQHLGEYALLTVTDEEVALAMNGESIRLDGRFWFGLRQDLPDGAIGPLQRSGALVIPAINTFRYPSHAHRELARRDVAYFMEQGVDGFQIDSVYGGFFVP